MTCNAIFMEIGPFQTAYFSKGIPKEGELICKKGKWYFNLVLDLGDTPWTENNTAIGVDLGENVIAALSSGEIIDGGKVRPLNKIRVS
jgi:transposase